MSNREIERLSDLILESDSTVALTGAGISTESGIPDFRTPGTGLYSKFNQDIFSTVRFREDPGYFYSFARLWLKDIQDRTPNQAHHTLAWLEQQHLLDYVITQNIDGLHRNAGSNNVLEIHGHLREAVCQGCGLVTDMEMVKQFLATNDQGTPSCPSCGGILKPNVVFFGDPLPDAIYVSMDAASHADLFLVLGSSLTVHPAASLPAYCQGKLVIINLSPTPMDQHADVVIRGKLGETLERLQQSILSRQEKKF